MVRAPQIEFYGVRGSCPCSRLDLQRYGGNTSCVVLNAPDHEPIVFDLGTGLRNWATRLPIDEPLHASALLTHMHWDHIQGLPFLDPIHRKGSRLDVYGPAQEDRSLGETMDGLMTPPYFPIHYRDLIADVTFHDLGNSPFTIGEAEVHFASVPHPGITVGFRVALRGRSVAYVPDHQAPFSLDTFDEGVVELCRDVDVLIHDAQYTRAEFEERSNWGHSTVGYAVDMGCEVGAGTVVLFHHDPNHDDSILDAVLDAAHERVGPGGPEIIAAHEGLILPLG